MNEYEYFADESLKVKFKIPHVDLYYRSLRNFYGPDKFVVTDLEGTFEVEMDRKESWQNELEMRKQPKKSEF